MTSYRIYKSTTGVEYNFYVGVDGKEEFVSFSGPGAVVFVEDPKLAEAIEESDLFKKRKIVLVSVVGDSIDENKAAERIGDEFPEVKNMIDAIEVLTTKYGVNESDIGRKAQVLAKAEELGVIFPNYK
jgi:hypothetical protein